MEELNLTTTPLDRLGQLARAWRVKIEDLLETETSVIATGTRDATAGEVQAVVLKVVKQQGDEWRSGDVLAAFDGHGVARVYEHEPGAVLLERLQPGNSLLDLTLSGRDEEATDILADVIKQMLQEKPAILGLAVAGKPMGSPGMEGGRNESYDVIAFERNGKTRIYAKR